MKALKILSLLVEQFQEKNHRLPEKIVIHPVAAVVLSARRSIAPVWNGIPVVCDDIKPKALGDKPATMLGVVVDKAHNGSLVGFDL